MGHFGLFAVLLGLAATSACHSFEVETPPGFVKLQNELYQYQAADASGVTVAVRELDARDADATFWEQAVSNQMARLGAYEVVEQRPVKTADGTEGKAFSFLRNQDGRKHWYSVAVFLKSDPWLLFDRTRLFVVESGGPVEAYEARRAVLDAQLANLDLDLPL